MVDVKFKIRHRQGHFLDISLTGNVLKTPDGSFRETFCIFHDITNQIQMSQALAAKQRELKSIFRIAPTGFGVVKGSL